MYKWVDEHGVTHYGQIIPPEYRDQGAEEMNRRGMTVRRIEPASTPEERRALEEKLEREREEQKRLAEQRRRDRALMNTYGSAEEIDAARDRNLAMPIQALRNLEPRMKKAQVRLANLEAKRDELTKAGKTPSDYLLEDIEAEKREVEAMRADMDRHVGSDRDHSHALRGGPQTLHRADRGGCAPLGRVQHCREPRSCREAAASANPAGLTGQLAAENLADLGRVGLALGGLHRLTDQEVEGLFLARAILGHLRRIGGEDCVDQLVQLSGIRDLLQSPRAR